MRGDVSSEIQDKQTRLWQVRLWRHGCHELQSMTRFVTNIYLGWTKQIDPSDDWSLSVWMRSGLIKPTLMTLILLIFLNPAPPSNNPTWDILHPDPLWTKQNYFQKRNCLVSCHWFYFKWSNVLSHEEQRNKAHLLQENCVRKYKFCPYSLHSLIVAMSRHNVSLNCSGKRQRVDITRSKSLPCLVDLLWY